MDAQTSLGPRLRHQAAAARPGVIDVEPVFDVLFDQGWCPCRFFQTDLCRWILKGLQKFELLLV